MIWTRSIGVPTINARRRAFSVSGAFRGAYEIRSRAAIVALLMLWCTSTCHGAEEHGFLDSNELFDLCKEGASITSQRMCLGYLMGAADVGQQLHKGKLCMPTGVTSSQLQEMLMNYLKENPKQLQYAAFSTVLTVFLDAFPCTRK